MKLNLKTVVCTLAIFHLKFKFNQTHRLPQDSLLVQTTYQHLQTPREEYSVQLKEDFAAQEVKELGQDFNIANHGNHARHYDHQHHAQHYFSDLHLKQLAESVKDPKNLRNGIYHGGAVTYDLGLPTYKILNPYEPPEIITPNHPQYHEQMNHIKKTNNFTFEDFGVSSMPEMRIIPATSTPYSETANSSNTPGREYSHIPTTSTFETPATTTAETTLTISTKPTTEPVGITTAQSPVSDHEPITNNTSKTKEKLYVLGNKLDLKTCNHTSSLPSADLKIVFIRSKEDSKSPQAYKIIVEPEQQTTFSQQLYEKDAKVSNDILGPSFLLSKEDQLETTHEPYKLKYSLPIPLLYDREMAIAPPKSHRKSKSQEELFEQVRLYRSPPEESYAETAPSTTTESLDATTNMEPASGDEDSDKS